MQKTWAMCAVTSTHQGSPDRAGPASGPDSGPAGETKFIVPGEDLVARPLTRVEQRLRDLLNDTARQPLPEVAAHLINAGGKRIRPLVLLLASRITESPEEQAVHLGCAAELIHSATLLHDDVLDEAELRRGRPAGRMVWGNTFSVLAGDLCLSLALTEVERAGDMRAIGTLASTVQSMVSAEVLQLDNRRHLEPSRDLYFKVIRGKTASLMSWCAAMAHLGPADTCKVLADFGHKLGLAFQIADDVLDYQASPEVTGKTVGRDLAEGKLTLPIIEALEENPTLRPKLEQMADLNTDAATLDALQSEIADAVRAGDALERSRKEAVRHATEARNVLSPLPDSAWRDALAELSLFTATRKK